MSNNPRYNQRTSLGFDKKLIGVPVFPGSNQIFNSNIVENNHATDSQHHPIYPHHSIDGNHYFTSNNATSNISTPTTATSNSNNNWKLRHVDFMPAAVKMKKDEDYEKFSVLMEKANTWSSDNPHALIFSCETVTWTTIDKPVFTDSGVMVKSMGSDKKTKYVRGLRLWYFVFEEVFIDKNTQLGPFKLGYTNYQFDGKAESSFTTLLNKVNADISKKVIPGKLVRLETLDMLTDMNDAETTVWYEQPEKSKDYTSFVRIFYTTKQVEGSHDIDDGSKWGEIGVKDFIPQVDNRTPHNQGYETYSDLWKKAAKFLYSSPQFKFINVQSVFVKVKKAATQPDTDLQSMVIWDKCTHCQHGSAYGSISSQKTEYLQILRLTYYKSNITNHNVVGSEVSTDVGKKMYYKYFSPGPLKRAFLSGQSGEDQDNLGTENLYEDLKQLEEKINAWINFSGAKVAGVETILTRLGSGGQEMFGPEATFIYNGRERNLSREPWRVTIRLAVEGEYKQIPVTWRNSILEQSINSQTTFTGGCASID